MSDCIFSHEPAIAPTAYAEPIWIGDLLLNKIIHAVHQVLVSHSAPVRDGCMQPPAFTSHTSSVGQENHVTIRRQKLSPGPPLGVQSHPPGCIAGMRVNNCRIEIARFVTGRGDEYASTDQAVLRVFPFYFAHSSQPPGLCL